ncbi:MAG: thermonuclease family protein [Desulfatiglandaceae bacterium]
MGHDIEITVRLAGIDAPEGATRKRIKIQPFSNEARDFLSALILNRAVDVRGHGTDRYNRVLAVVFIDGLNVNKALLHAGLAETWRGNAPKNLDLDTFWHVEDEAKQKGRGMWRLGPNYISPAMWRKTAGR